MNDLKEQLLARLAARRAAAKETDSQEIDETPDQRVERLMKDDSAWTSSSLMGCGSMSISPR